MTADSQGELSADDREEVLAKNKANAMAFYDLMFNQCQPRAAIEKYVGERYIQHNPEVGDGKAAFVAYFERMQAENPGKRDHFKRVVAESDLPWNKWRQPRGWRVVPSASAACRSGAS